MVFVTLGRDARSHDLLVLKEVMAVMKADALAYKELAHRLKRIRHASLVELLDVKYRKVPIEEGNQQLLTSSGRDAYQLMIYAKYYPSCSIYNLIQTTGVPLCHAMCAYVMYRVTQAVQMLHEKGIVHGRITPHNVLLTPELNVYLNNCGAYLYEDLVCAACKEAEQQQVDNLRWLAPEVIHDPQMVTKDADIYAMGTLFDFMSRLRKPAPNAQNAQQLRDAFLTPDTSEESMASRSISRRVSNEGSFRTMCRSYAEGTRPSINHVAVCPYLARAPTNAVVVKSICEENSESPGGLDLDDDYPPYDPDDLPDAPMEAHPNFDPVLMLPHQGTQPYFTPTDLPLVSLLRAPQAQPAPQPKGEITRKFMLPVDCVKAVCSVALDFHIAMSFQMDSRMILGSGEPLSITDGHVVDLITTAYDDYIAAGEGGTVPKQLREIERETSDFPGSFADTSQSTLDYDVPDDSSGSTWMFIKENGKAAKAIAAFAIGMVLIGLVMILLFVAVKI